MRQLNLLLKELDMESVYECVLLKYTTNTAENPHQLDETPVGPGETDAGRKEKETKKCFWWWPVEPGETDGQRKEAEIEEKKKDVWKWPILHFPRHRTAKYDPVKAEKEFKCVAGTYQRHDNGTII